jgi:enterochelin esterase-like enzyme
MANLGRLAAVIAAVLLVVGAAVFLFFRSSIASEGIYRVATQVGVDTATPERHIVPKGFKGWAVVHYAVEGAAPLRDEAGARLLEYPASGRLDTSTPAPEDEGFLHRGYYSGTADGLAPLSRVGDIWGEFSHVHFPDDGSGVVSRSSGFFVGTMKEFLATEWPVEHRLPAGPEPGIEEAIEEIEAGRASTPVILQPTPGSQATVVFLVQSADGPTPRIVSDVTGWGESPDDSHFDVTIGAMTRVGATDWYRLTTLVAPRSRIEYLVVYGETDYRVDPHNPRRAWSPGGHAISEFVTPDYEPPRELADPAVSPEGRVVEATLESDALGAPRGLLVYLPPGYRDDGDYPVAVFHSGGGIVREGQAPRVLDWMIAQREIEPIVGLFLDSYIAGDPDNHEGPPLRSFLCEEAPKWLASRYGVSKVADDWAVLAKSYGAQDALDAALAPAQIYGGVGLLIPGRRLTPSHLEGFARKQGRRLRIAILAGRYDQANLATADSTRKTLADAGHQVDFIEVPEGHNPSTWRNHFRDVLVSLFDASRVRPS